MFSTSVSEKWAKISSDCFFTETYGISSAFLAEAKILRLFNFLCCRFSMIWCDRSTEKRRWKRRRQKRSQIAHCSKMPSHSSSRPGEWVLRQNVFQACAGLLLLTELWFIAVIIKASMYCVASTE